MKANFPVEVTAVFCGKAGSGGSFVDRETGDTVSFTDAYAFDFDDTEGNVQRLVVRVKNVDDVADFKVEALTRYAAQIHIEGNAVINDEGRSFFRATKMTLVKKPA